jgi:hypothetical protein
MGPNAVLLGLNAVLMHVRGLGNRKMAEYFCPLFLTPSLAFPGNIPLNRGSRISSPAQNVQLSYVYTAQ